MFTVESLSTVIFFDSRSEIDLKHLFVQLFDYLGKKGFIGKA